MHVAICRIMLVTCCDQQQPTLPSQMFSCDDAFQYCNNKKRECELASDLQQETMLHACSSSSRPCVSPWGPSQKPMLSCILGLLQQIKAQELHTTPIHITLDGANALRCSLCLTCRTAALLSVQACPSPLLSCICFQREQPQPSSHAWYSLLAHTDAGTMCTARSSLLLLLLPPLPVLSVWAASCGSTTDGQIRV